jgi:hypothetical protein
MQADLAGLQTINAIAERLAQKGVSVSVLDVSNAPDYFLGNEYEEKNLKNYLRNLNVLPVSSNAHVNFTTQAIDPERDESSPRPALGQWSYYSVPYKQYIADLTELEPSGHEALFKLINRLERSSSDLVHGLCQHALDPSHSP